jgi:phosphopantetheinyl transferase (holo-ACP synthase)
MRRRIEDPRDPLISHCFVQEELDQVGDGPGRRLVGRFAAKEAVLKALGTGFGAIFVTTRGEYQVTTSDGVTRRFPVGSVLIIEDTTGAGHSTKITSVEDAIGFAVALPAKAPT